ncbi:MAG TPA: trypsin-like peptidase domain-containing protein [Acidimicrobiales bacterium]
MSDSSDTERLESTERLDDPTQPFEAPSRSSTLPPPPPPRPSYAPAPDQSPYAGLRPNNPLGVSWPTAPPSAPQDDEVWSGPAHGAATDEAWRAFGATPPPPLPPGEGRAGGGSQPSGGKQRAVFVAVVAIVALVAGLLGAVIGATAADDDEETSSPARPTVDQNTSSGSVTPPITGPVEEPVAAVAQAVGPSVVLIATDIGEGSGIIYDEGGYILTNAHVVEGFRRVFVRLANGSVYEDAEVVGADDRRDIAVVRIEPREPLTAAVFGPTAEVHVGQMAVAIGSPFGLEQTVTAGIVSAIGRVVSPTNPVEMIQTDAPINPGNSGGPLADAQGRVIGMNTSIRTASGVGGSVGVGFAIPSDTLLDIADRIVNGESLEVAYLGVRGSEPTGSPGIVIVEVMPASPAEAAGLQEGDRVLAIDGDEVTSMLTLSARIQLHRPGDTIELTIERDGQQQTVTVTLGTYRR